MNVRTTSLSCQKCGGALACTDNQHAYRCEYCCQLSILSDGPLLVDGIQPVDEQVESACPTCCNWLHTAQLDGRPVLYCRCCYGMLVRRDHFGAIVNERRSKRADREQEICRPIDSSALRRRLRCPACEGNMEAHPYYGPGNVVIDSCDDCGYVWLDHGELSRVERAAGGREPVSMNLPVDTAEFSSVSPAQESTERHPIALLADFLF